MKVALCFWGLCRSTQFTIDSIQSCILQPLINAGIEYEIYIHTYSITKSYSNIRANEMNLLLDNNLWRLLKPNYNMLEDQDTIKEQLNLKSYRKRGNPWNDDKNTYTTLDNHILALWSLKQVTSLWEPKANEYSKIVYLRPDVRFLNPIQISWLTTPRSSTILIPNFHLIQNCNDRFAIGDPHVMAIYGNRFQSAYIYSLKELLHSETFLSYILAKHSIQIQHIPFKFIRIRAGGQECPGDKKL